MTYLFGDGISFDMAADIEGILDPPFEISPTGQTICNVDRLRRSLYKLWLPEIKRKIREASNQNVNLVLNWIERIESDPQIIPAILEPNSDAQFSTTAP